MTDDLKAGHQPSVYRSAAKLARVAGRGTRATDQLARLKIAYTVHHYEHDPRGADGYGLEAARALGVPPERVFKTLIADVDDRLTVAVVPVAGTLDLKALAGAAGGKKARLADPAAAERATGYVPGGISPLGQRRALPVVLDETARQHATIMVSAGQRGLEIEIAPADLVRAASATVAPIARPPG
jgi:Cys-tRNA(Pro)/Cys-tRNA(Cys) deacylase